MTDHRERVEELLAEYRRSRQHLATVQQRLGAIAETATGAGGAVTATVGARGTVTGLTISDDAYRYRPPELAAEILHAVQAATVAALDRAGEVLAPALPPGTDPHALLLGTGDLTADEVVADPPAAPAAADDDDDDDFAAHSWVTEGRER